MSNQLQITGGAKVRNLEGVLTGTSGVVSSLGINVPDGIPQLDGSGKILVSQLPNSVMEFKGTWDASTNTPTLANGTGNAGDVYLCNVAGTVNFGAGPITFYVGDQALYSGSIWQRASGSTGTVTSVALTESGDALNITGSPITTSGTINIGFNGTSGQYINGEGNLTTFPSLTGYVPYTGATGNVNLGSNNITASNLFGETSLNVKILGSGSIYSTGYSTFSTLAGKLTLAQEATAGNLKAFTFDFSAWSTNTSYTYTLPAASGTIALTSNLSSYVPYTGATANVDLGSYDLTTDIVNLNQLKAVGSGGLNIYSNSGTHIALMGGGGGAGITFYGGLIGTTANFSGQLTLGSTITNGTNIYTLPSITGTLALLEGSQTFTGLKSFDAGLSLKDAVYPTPLSGYSSIGANPFGISIVTNQSSTIYRSDLGFPAAQRTYTFPNIDGTVALLEGTQTFTGDKTFSGDTIFNGGVDINNSAYLNAGVFFRNNAVGSTLYTNFSILKSGSLETLTYLFTTSNSSKLVFNDAANYTYTFPTTSGTLALSSDLSSYVPYTGATANLNLGSSYYVISNDITFWKGAGTGLGNIGLGRIVPLANNTTGQVNLGILESALFSNTTGSNNIALGGATMYSNTTGSNNIAIGSSANRTNATGDGNIAIGVNALYNNTVNYNIAIGAGTLYTNTTGNNNIGIGQNTLYSTTTGSQNTAIGTGSLTNQTTGINNTAYGISTGFNVTTGIQNTFIGYSAGSGITTGSHNTIIGGNVGALASNLTNNVIIADGQGNYRFQWDSNNTIIGQSGNVGIGNASPSFTLDVTGTGRFTGALSGTSATFSGFIQGDYFQTGSNPATSGGVRLGTQVAIRARNVANTNNIPLIESTSTDAVSIASGGANVGIGITSPGTKLHIFGVGTTYAQIQGTAGNTTGLLTNNNSRTYFTGTYYNITDAWEVADITAGGLTRLAITSSGNVGIGTTSPSSKLDILGANNVMNIAGTNSVSAYLGWYYNTSTLVGYIGNGSSILTGAASSDFIFRSQADLVYATGGNNERMRITSGGNVLIGTTSTLPGSTNFNVSNADAGPTFANANSTQQSLLLWNKGTSGNNLFTEFHTESSITIRGSIDYNRASNVTRYNTTSDGNLKNIIGDSDKQKSIDILNSTRIREYSWKEDETNKPQIGVIAQELYETYKGAVSKGSDKELFGTEDYKTWGVDKTAFTFHLIAGWQMHEQMIKKQQAIIQELSAKVSALENKS